MATKSERQEKLKSVLLPAIQRLRNGSPLNEKLREKPNIRCNVLNIALEANVSRTLFCGVHCEYPEVRDWLQAEIHESKGSTIELRKQVAALKDKISQLEDSLDESATYNSDLIIRAHRASRGLLPGGGSAARVDKKVRAAALSVVGRDEPTGGK